MGSGGGDSRAGVGAGPALVGRENGERHVDHVAFGPPQGAGELLRARLELAEQRAERPQRRCDALAVENALMKAELARLEGTALAVREAAW